MSRQLDKLGGLLHRIVGRGVTLSIVPAPTPLLVEMDATQFEQVVTNLMVNARDSMCEGGAITVVVESIAADGDARSGFVRLSVTDTGTGIPPDVPPHIFEPFFSTKTAGQGTGLGLATCDGVVRRSGGRVEVTTDVGKGTRFDVYLARASVA